MTRGQSLPGPHVRDRVCSGSFPCIDRKRTCFTHSGHCLCVVPHAWNLRMQSARMISNASCVDLKYFQTFSRCGLLSILPSIDPRFVRRDGTKPCSSVGSIPVRVGCYLPSGIECHLDPTNHDLVLPQDHPSFIKRMRAIPECHNHHPSHHEDSCSSKLAPTVRIDGIV